MNNEQWDACIKKAVKVDMGSYPQPDTERMWQRIESNIQFSEGLNELPRKRRNSLWLKVASVLVVLALSALVLSKAPVGEALPFGWVFQGLRQFVTGDQTLIQFSFGEEEMPAARSKTPPPPPPEFVIEEMEAPQTNLTTIALDELLNIYPGVLYYPQEYSTDTLKMTQYLHVGEMWLILMDFSINGYDILLSQQDIVGKGGAGVGFGADTVVSFHRLDGVEYMVSEHRYGIVGVKWNKEHKLFDLTCNLTVEEALALARSLEPYPH